MYGLILLNMSEFVSNKFGDNMWKKVKEQINLEQDFVANESYPEQQLMKMVIRMSTTQIPFIKSILKYLH